MELKTMIIQFPNWMKELLENNSLTFPAIEDRMRFVLKLAKLNIENKTGGPFAAAIFDHSNGKLIAPGVNLVTSSGFSTAHAEIMAVMQAQVQLKNYDLGANGLPVCELVSSTAPCAMCLGAIPWSGVRSLVCGARDEDARAVGFDEGAKPANWNMELEKRGIKVIVDICREDAISVLREYIKLGGVIYNGRMG